MENNSKTIRTLLILICIGVWFIVFQNFGILPRMGAVDVKATEPLKVTGNVEVENQVNIKGQVDANIESINGHNKFYKDPRTGDYYVIPITDPYE